MFDVKRAGREQRRDTACRRYRVKMRPTIAFPCKDEPVAGSPQQLVFSQYPTVDAALAFSSFPNSPPNSSGNGCNTDGPWRTRTHRLENDSIFSCGNTKKSNAEAVRRPNWFDVVIDTRIQIFERLRAEQVNANEAVISAGTHERQRVAFRRPSQGCFCRIRLNELLRLLAAVEPYLPDLAFVEIGNCPIDWRDRRRVPFRKFSRLGAAHFYYPNGLLDSQRG